MGLGNPNWVAGTSGNPAGRAVEAEQRIYRAALMRAIDKAGRNPDALDKIAATHIARCEAGDMVAIKEFADRIEGKVPQVVQGPNGGAAVQLTLIVSGVPRLEDDSRTIEHDPKETKAP